MVTSTSTPGSREMEVYNKHKHMYYVAQSELATHDLLNDLAGGVEVDKALVDLELVAVPGLRTLTARLKRTQ